MGMLLNANDVFEIALEIERNGAAWDKRRKEWAI